MFKELIRNFCLCRKSSSIRNKEVKSSQGRNRITRSLL